jgi:putative tryptophan/tyrosine transport system substrate-binding protein
MGRRDLMALVGSAAISWPLGAEAQQTAMPVVGVLSIFSRFPLLLADGLREAGYIAGQDVTFEYRFAEGHYDLLPALAADLVSRNVDVIVTIGGTPAALAAKNATTTIPIVFTSVSDPVGVGLVEGLARPGGNLAGFSNIAVGLVSKEIELITELVPRAGVIVLLVTEQSDRRPAGPGRAASSRRERGEARRLEGRRGR